MTSSDLFSETEILDISQMLISKIVDGSENVVQETLEEGSIQADLQTLLTACQCLDTFLNQKIINKTGQYVNSNEDTKDIEEVLRLGAMLIFQLRKFITGQALNFVVAGQTSKEILKEKTYSQDEIFSLKGVSNISVSFSQAAILLGGELEYLRNLDDVQHSVAEKWKKILKYGFVTDVNSQSEIDKGAYHKIDPDINVYLRFETGEGGRKTLTHYYLKQGDAPDTREDFKKLNGLIAYDKGWMYQWLKFNTAVSIDSKSPTPLLNLMLGKNSIRENVPGIKGGDNKLDQYKFQNKRIITFNNIQEILSGGGKSNYIGIIPSLELLISNWNTPQQALRQLVKDFTTLNDDQVKRFVRNHLKEVTNKLTET